MKFAVVLFCVAVFACAEPQSETPNSDASVVSNPKQQIFLGEDGRFVLRFTDIDGTVLEEEGVIMANEETDNVEILVKKGTYYYRTADGQLHTDTYDIDEPLETAESQ